jgi:hypothetical protein
MNWVGYLENSGAQNSIRFAESADQATSTASSAGKRTRHRVKRDHPWPILELDKPLAGA